jgi:hypothetical protein
MKIETINQYSPSCRGANEDQEYKLVFTSCRGTEVLGYTMRSPPARATGYSGVITQQP